MLVVPRDFLGESHPPTGERPEGVLGGRAGRVDGARSESGAAREQAVIGEIVEGFSQDGRGLHDDLLQRVHRRGARFHGGIPCDLELADHLDGAVRGLGDGRRLPREQGPRRHLGVDGVGLADGAACTAVAPIHFHDMMPGSADGPCQASAVAPGAFDPERLNPPVCLGPRDQSLQDRLLRLRGGSDGEQRVAGPRDHWDQGGQLGALRGGVSRRTPVVDVSGRLVEQSKQKFERVTACLAS